MRILVLGAYGLIGAEVVRRLEADGFDVIGFGRSAEKGRRLMPQLAWVGADLADMTDLAAWAPMLAGMEGVVNASGALQDGAGERLEIVQDRAIRALIAASEQAGVRRFVQVSAPGAREDAATAFLATKGVADAALRRSALEWAVLKPGLVISVGAYGGTSLIRMLAAFPLVTPLVLANSKMQTVAATDLAEAVSLALRGERTRLDVDLVEREPHTLAEIVAAFRAWLGFAPSRAVIELPRWMGFAVARCADVAGLLGWRAPLRTTALRVLAEDVVADARAGGRFLDRPLKSLDEALAMLPATAQERTYARAQLVFPVLVTTLAVFWIASGVIALWQADAAVAVLARSAAAPAHALVVGGAVLDIAIGSGLCVRRWTRRAAWVSVLTSLAYLAAGTWLTPEIWTDPLGPFVKILPAIALGLAVAALAEER